MKIKFNKRKKELESKVKDGDSKLCINKDLMGLKKDDDTISIENKDKKISINISRKLLKKYLSS